MVRAESTNTSIAGIDKNHSNVFTLLPVTGTQRYIWTKVDAVRISPVATWSFISGLHPQTMLKAPHPPKLKYETLYLSKVFAKF